MNTEIKSEIAGPELEASGQTIQAGGNIEDAIERFFHGLNAHGRLAVKMYRELDRAANLGERETAIGSLLEKLAAIVKGPTPDSPDTDWLQGFAEGLAFVNDRQ